MYSTGQRKKKSIFLRLALIAFAVYVVVSLVQLQIQIREQATANEAAAAYAAQLAQQNQYLENMLDNPDNYKNQQAHENGYVEPGADVYKPYQ